MYTLDDTLNDLNDEIHNILIQNYHSNYIGDEMRYPDGRGYCSQFAPKVESLQVSGLQPDKKMIESMCKYKIGVRIKNIGTPGPQNNHGKCGIVYKIDAHKVYVRYDDQCLGECVLIEAPDYYKVINKKSLMENLTEKFVLALTPEPKKSFRKAGITNGDDLLTDEGRRVFLSWLLHSKFADEFKKEVVDPLLAEKEKED